MCMWYVRGITLKVIYSLRSRSGKKTTLSGPQGGFRIPGGKLENKALAGKGSVTFPPQGFTVITTAIVQEEQLGRRGYSSVGPDWIPSRQSWTWRAVEKSPHWSGHCMVPVQTEISSPISEPFLCFPGVFYIGLLSNLHWHLEQSLNSLCLTGRHHLCRNNTNITHPQMSTLRVVTGRSLVSLMKHGVLWFPNLNPLSHLCTNWFEPTCWGSRSLA